MATTLKIDAKDLERLAQGFSAIRNALPEALEHGNPEFGAYMKYSRFLEEGTRRMVARPHIRPAVFSSASDIVGEFLKEARKALDKHFNTGRGIPRGEEIEKLWERVLNGKPRAHAVDSARRQEVFEFGFHIRSIRGYGNTRPVSEIKRDQELAERERKERRKANSRPNKSSGESS